MFKVNDTIRFSKLPGGSYATVGIDYTITHVGRSSIRIENNFTGSSTIENLALLKRTAIFTTESK